MNKFLCCLILALTLFNLSYRAEEKLYFTTSASTTNAYAVARSDLDGSNTEAIIADDGSQIPYGIDLDLTNNKVYFTDKGNSKIRRCDFDGSNVEDLITDVVATDIVLDVANDKMYYTITDGTNMIYTVNRADLDGSNAEIIVADDGSISPMGITIDLTNEKIYFADKGNNKIRKCDYDGGNLVDVLTDVAVVDIAIDVSNFKMYYTIDDGDNTIYTVNSADLDGSNAAVIVADDGYQTPYGIAIDLVNEVLYYVDRGNKKIRQCDYDGGNLTDLITNTKGVYIAGTTTSPTLPVELASFSAALLDGQITVAWQTSTETNNSGFYLERSTDLTESWSKIAFIEGSGTSNSSIDYSYVDSALPDSGTVAYRLKQIDNDGSCGYSKTVSVNLSAVTGVESDEIEYDFSLNQNYPNPFNPTTTISYSIPERSHVSLKVYDILGEEVADLVNEEKNAGSYNVTFNASNLSSGMYLYKISTDSNTQTKKLLLVK